MLKIKLDSLSIVNDDGKELNLYKVDNTDDEFIISIKSDNNDDFFNFRLKDREQLLEAINKICKETKCKK